MTNVIILVNCLALAISATFAGLGFLYCAKCRALARTHRIRADAIAQYADATGMYRTSDSFMALAAAQLRYAVALSLVAIFNLVLLGRMLWNT